MKRLMLAITVLVLSTAATAYGQQPMAPGDAPRPPSQMQPGHPGGGMPMDMCREMMAGHGMMGGAEPRMMGHMMEMRGEMMKAMGEIMMKHGQKMQAPPAK
jgi:hypothetical protein